MLTPENRPLEKLYALSEQKKEALIKLPDGTLLRVSIRDIDFGGDEARAAVVRVKQFLGGDPVFDTSSLMEIPEDDIEAVTAV